MRGLTGESNFVLEFPHCNRAGSNKELDMSYQVEFESTVAGIPCIIAVEEYFEEIGRAHV